MRYHVLHKTEYVYTDSVSLCQNVAHLSPRECDQQQTSSSQLAISPTPAVLEDRVDYFGNPTKYFTIQEQHRRLVVTATHQIALTPVLPPEATATPTWESVRDRLREERQAEWLEAKQFVFDSRFVQTLVRYEAYTALSFTPGCPILAAALDLMRRIHKEFVYDPRATTIATPVVEVFDKRRGVCQDFAHLQIACLRSLGLAARYVSGYLSTQTPMDGNRLIGADATHAWLSIFCGEAGWVDLDPTNDQIPNERHLLLAWGRDYEDVSPLKGVILGGGQHTVNVAVKVERIHDDLERNVDSSAT
jgi:transglutaminase-like putative cysteine protease